MKVSKRVRVLIFGAVLLILYASGFLVRNRYGISVIIKNNTEYQINDLQITDESHAETHKFVLPPGARRRVWVNPAGETSIFLRFTDHQNIQRREVIAGYVESGYCGNINVEITAQEIRSFDNVDIAFCKSSWEDFL